ncbi:MAG: hypothetical protein HFI63_00840 [Lachnospiraceae bacterium]|nr:hypothetical protein [Lachnospiraceae bacterium]
MKPAQIKVNDKGMYQYFQEEAGQVFKELCKKENPYMPMQFTADAIVEICRNLEVFYSRKEVMEEACLIDNVLEILHQYMGIEGMENLLLSNYAAIENAIFLEYSSGGTPGRIREHYKHQFRNAYLGLLLLDRMKLDRALEACLQEENNEYASYIMDCIRRDMEEGIAQEDAKQNTLREIIYKSYFAAALFHDIGYPLAHYFRASEQIQQFVPFFKIVNPGVKTEFPEIKAILNNSLLFRTIDAQEIKKKYENNDHGCLSAISFLMNFYFSGSIYNLGKGEKNRCIVEMAAVAIYKHTDKFNGADRMIFSRDPISYLVRICDDMQEWQRFMVLIEDTHNYLMCTDCGRIIHPGVDDAREYECDCGKQFRKITAHENKKVNYVDLCDSLTLSFEKETIVVDLHYNYYRQIELILSDYQGVIFREKGLQELHRMLQVQKYIPKIELRYMLSNNPVYLIQKMIEESMKDDGSIRQWIDHMKEGERKEHLSDFYEEYQRLLPEVKQKFGEKLEENAVRYARASKEFIKKYLGEIYQLWDFLSPEEE